MKEKCKIVLKKLRRKFSEYVSTNRLFLSYVLFSIVQTVLIRTVTLGNVWDYKPFLVDLAFIFLLGSFGYLVKPKNRFTYFFILLIVITMLSVINSIYYTFYLTFTSFSLLASLSQVGDVTDSLVEKLRIIDFIYLLFPIFFYYVHKLLNKTSYYHYVTKIEKGKKMFLATALAGIILIAFTMVTMTKTDYSRISKQWNREYIVERFGILLYQGNDLIQSLTPKISSLFGYDEAARTYREFYAQLGLKEQQTNKYTNIFKDKNVIFVHMESIQNNLMDLSFNGVEVLPNIKKLASEGMYFNNFYPQISTGTSSDSEFTLLTSLMPALSGTVAVSYFDREYLSIPKLLKEQGYYIFSMHGNKADMWNRANLHQSLGYDKFYSKKDYDVNKENTIGLGISDKAFFEQSLPILQKIESEKEKYMGTIITLSNHSPFGDLEEYGEYDLSFKEIRLNQAGEEYEYVDEYLNNRKLGNYIKSAHYADFALGEFMQNVKNSENFNDTVFVFYGDHDAKIAQSEYDYLYNYDLKTGTMKKPNDPGYVDYSNFSNELNKNTPLIIWTKDEALQKKIRGKFNYPMGMYDILPTLGNMMDFKSPYALGEDIFNVKDNNIVIFPNGNFLSNKVYYNNSNDEYMPLNKNLTIDADYIEKCKEYAEKRLIVSNNIIIHDLIKKESNKANYSEERK